MAADTVITAMLIRGKKYSYNQVLKSDELENPTETKFHAFERGVPIPVSAVLADELEELVEVVKSADGEDEIEKPRFQINRSAPRHAVKAIDANKKVRMRLVAVEDRERKPAALVKPKPQRGLYGRSIGR